MSQYKTVLAPNAPWPNKKPKPKVKVAVSNENKCKAAVKLRERDVLTGRLKGSNKPSGSAK